MTTNWQKDPKSNRYIAQIEEHVRPIFNADSGARLELIRMKMLMSQGELAELLGTSQQQISKLERGHLDQAPFTLARLRAVIDTHFHFILFGSGPADQWSVRKIHTEYWKHRLKTRRIPGSGTWHTEQQAMSFKHVLPYHWKGRLHGPKKKDGSF